MSQDFVTFDSQSGRYSGAMMTQRLKQSLLMRYWSIGGMATVLHYLVFLLLLTVWTPTLATLLGGIAGAMFSYWANKRFTFCDDADKELGMARFYAVTFLYNLANVGLIEWVSRAWPQDSVIYWLLIQIAITLFLSVISFFIHKYWSYRYA